MFPRDFAYWLMGFFELAIAANYIKELKYPSEQMQPPLFEFDSCFNESKFRETITNHCNLVLATKGEFKTDYLDFVKWVKTALEFDASLYVIYKKLSTFFSHVIDEDFKSQKDLASVHKPEPKDDDNYNDYRSRVLMC